MKKEWAVLLLPTTRSGNILPGEDSSVRNQNVKPRDFLLYLVAELVDRLELGEVNNAEFDVVVAGDCLDVYSPR